MVHDVSMSTISLSIFGLAVRIRCYDGDSYALMRANYTAFPDAGAPPELGYVIRRRWGATRFHVTRYDKTSFEADDTGDLLHSIETDIIIALQRLRSDLYFIHAAALEFAGRMVLLVGESGGGKSTLAWALLHHGFRYVSDELAPFDPVQQVIHPYPHALCLKRRPPEPYVLPADIYRTPRTFHIPVTGLPADAVSRPLCPQIMFFVNYQADAIYPSIKRISPAEAAAHLYTNALNVLAHPGDGLDTAIAIATACQCYMLTSTDLAATCHLVVSAMGNQESCHGRLKGLNASLE